MKKIVAVVLAVCVWASLFATSARGAVWIPPHPWEVEFEDYGLIFIMTPTPGQPNHGLPNRRTHWDEMVLGLREYGSDWWLSNIGPFDDERWDIRSGLYYNTDPLVNIYYVDEYFSSGSLFFSSDGRHFVDVQWSTANLKSEALRFFIDGEYVSSYQVSDFSDRVAGSSVGLHFINEGGIEHDQQAATISFVTPCSLTFTFDITTGEHIGGDSLNVNDTTTDEPTNVNFNPQTGA